MQRLGFRISRGWTLLLLVLGGLIAAAFWIGPLRPLPAELQLLGVTGDVAQPALESDGRMTSEGTVRYAIPLAVRNIGAQPAQPTQLRLSMPSHYHLTTRRGRMTGEVTAGVPLRRYTIDLDAVTVPIDSATMYLPGLDTIWIEPDLPRYYCVMGEGDVPEFVPAPERDPATLADLSIFYSFRTRAATERHTGLLRVQLDPSMLRSRPAPMPPLFPTVRLDVQELQEQQARGAAPDSAAAADSTAAAASAATAAPEGGEAGAAEDGRIRLIAAGSRRAYCGDPESPIELYTTRHETLTGGRVYTIHVAEEPLKRLYDLNGDDVIEQERWDSDGDGLYEAQRQARYEVPEFLLPLALRQADLIEPDTVPPDSAWLSLFGNTAAGPFRFSRDPSPAVGPDSLVVDSLRPDSLRRDSTGTVIMPAADTAAAAADSAARDTVVPRPPPPRRRGPLGTPVTIPPPDTTRVR